LADTVPRFEPETRMSRAEYRAWPDTPRVAHHQRAPGGDVVTTVVTEGDIMLHPPGITMSVADLYAD